MARILLSSVIANREFHSISPEATLKEAARLLCADWAHGALPVVQDGTLVGLVSKRDLLCRGVCGDLDLDSTPVRAVMTEDPKSLGADETLADAYRMMREAGVRHIPVTENGALVGMVAYRDVPISVKNLVERFAEFSHSAPEVFEH